MLDSLGERGCLVGPFRDALGVRRDIVRPARVPVLFFHEGRRAGMVAWLHLEAVALGHGHAYAHPEWLAFHPMDRAFRQAMTMAWDEAVAHVGAERVAACSILMDTAGRSISAGTSKGCGRMRRPSAARRFALVGPGRCNGGHPAAPAHSRLVGHLGEHPVPGRQLHSRDVSTGGTDTGEGEGRAGLGQSRPRSPSSLRQRDGRLANRPWPCSTMPERVDRIIVTAASLDETLRRIADHRQRVTELLAATGETHGPEIRRFLEEYRGSANPTGAVRRPGRRTGAVACLAG